MWLHGWLVRRLGKGSECACTTSTASAGSVSVAAIATATAFAAAAAIAASVAAAAIADASVAAAVAVAAAAVAAAAVSRFLEAAGVPSSSFIHGSLWRRGFLGRALMSCARMHAARCAAGQESSEADGASGKVTRREGQHRLDLWAP